MPFQAPPDCVQDKDGFEEWSHNDITVSLVFALQFLIHNSQNVYNSTIIIHDSDI